MRVLITAAELGRQSRISMRQVQTWTNAGALLPETACKHPGRGGTRLYPLEETEVAKMLGAISHQGMSVTEVKSVADVIRKVILVPQRYQFTNVREAAELRSVLRAQLPQERQALKEQAAAVLKRHGKKWQHVKFNVEEISLIEGWIAVQLAKQRELFSQITLLRGSDGSWLVWAGILGGRRPDYSPTPSNWRAGYILNLRKIFGD